MACGLLLFVSSAEAEVSLPTVLSDHRVLQRDEPVPVWGKAEMRFGIVQLATFLQTGDEPGDGTWADNPDTANLVNQEGLPASPFRTDAWPGITQGR